MLKLMNILFSFKELKPFNMTEVFFHFNVDKLINLKKTSHFSMFLFLFISFTETSFPKFQLLNSGCGLSASVAYLQEFTPIQWHIEDCITGIFFSSTYHARILLRSFELASQSTKIT